MANTQIATKQSNIKEWLTSDTLKNQIATALPSVCTPDRFMRVLLTSIQKTPKLALCSQASLFQSFMTCAQLGIEPDGRRAHLIPFENRKRGTVDCTLIIDYKGLVELVKRSGDVRTVYAETVCANDTFAWENGDVRHSIDFSKPRGEAYAYYARVQNKDGSTQAVVMTKDEVEKIRLSSRGKDSDPWTKHFDEMGKKTAFRRLCKWLVLSPETQALLDETEHAEFAGEHTVAADSLDDILAAATQADATVVEPESGDVAETERSAE